MDGSGGGSSESEITGMVEAVAPSGSCSEHEGSSAVCDGGGGGGGASAASADGSGEEGSADVSDGCDQAPATSPLPAPDHRNGARKPEKLAQNTDAAVAPVASTSFKRSGGTGSSTRRTTQKRVVTVPIADVAEGSRPRSAGGGGAGVGDAAPPPSDSWTWRKYGQKPIKGSPYPRGYYRCSSSKGCPARKQVERSRTDPTMLIITYASEHNHPWPVPRNNSSHHAPRQLTAAAQAAAPLPVVKLPSPSSVDEEDMEAEYEPLVEEEVDEKMLTVEPTDPKVITSPGITTTTTTATPTTVDAPATSTSSPSEETFSAEHSFSGASDDSTTLMPPLAPDGVDDLCSTWFPGVDAEISLCPTASTAAMMLPFSYDELRADLGGRSGGGCGVAGDDNDEDSLFAGLGELPEFSFVFRRGMMPEYAADLR